MDIYAARLASGFAHTDINAISFYPHSKLERFAPNRMAMRWLRYRAYPKLVQKLRDCGEFDERLVHITDHGYAHLLDSLNGVESVVSVHDLIPLMAWRGNIVGLEPMRKPYLALYSHARLASAGRLIASSRNTANDLINQLNLPANKIEVVYCPIDSGFFDPDAARRNDFRARYEISADKKIVFLPPGGFYKNHRMSVAVATKLLDDDDVHLVTTGRRGLGDEFLKLPRERISCLWLDAHELPSLYRAADLVLFPSLYEGFGYPVAEALASGTSVVASDRASLPEVGGQLALYADALDVDSLYAQCRRALYDRDWVEHIRASGPTWAERFSISQVCNQIGQVYASI